MMTIRLTIKTRRQYVVFQKQLRNVYYNILFKRVNFQFRVGLEYFGAKVLITYLYFKCSPKDSKPSLVPCTSAYHSFEQFWRQYLILPFRINSRVCRTRFIDRIKVHDLWQLQALENFSHGWKSKEVQSNKKGQRKRTKGCQEKTGEKANVWYLHLQSVETGPS